MNPRGKSGLPSRARGTVRSIDPAAASAAAAARRPAANCSAGPWGGGTGDVPIDISGAAFRSTAGSAVTVSPSAAQRHDMACQ
ncbi:hypothetical protein GCM10017687_55300 [Streptomyces echinatus]